MDAQTMVFYERMNPTTGKAVCVAGGFELPAHKPFMEKHNMVIPVGLFCYQPTHASPMYEPDDYSHEAVQVAPADMMAKIVELAQGIKPSEDVEKTKQGVVDGANYCIKSLDSLEAIHPVKAVAQTTVVGHKATKRSKKHGAKVTKRKTTKAAKPKRTK